MMEKQIKLGKGKFQKVLTLSHVKEFLAGETDQITIGGHKSWRNGKDDITGTFNELFNLVNGYATGYSEDTHSLKYKLQHTKPGALRDELMVVYKELVKEIKALRLQLPAGYFVNEANNYLNRGDGWWSSNPVGDVADYLTKRYSGQTFEYIKSLPEMDVYFKVIA